MASEETDTPEGYKDFIRFLTRLWYRVQWLLERLELIRRFLIRHLGFIRFRQIVTLILALILVGLMVYNYQYTEGTCNISLPRRLKIRNERWQVVSNGREEIILYRSYYDDRYDLMGNQYVRVLAVASVNAQAIFCQLWYEATSVPYVLRASVTFMGDWSDVEGVTYKEVMYNCKLPGGTRRPSKVSLSFKPCATSTVLLPISLPDKSRSKLWEDEFAVCVPITSKQLTNPWRIIEWAEINRLFGVSEIHVYYNHLNQEVKRVLEHYQNEGFLQLHYHPLPFEGDESQFRPSSLVSVNDCMYRNMYRHKYIAVLDTDENIVPRLDYNYNQMMKRIDAALLINSAPSYTFRNAYFWFDFSPLPSVQDKLQSLRYRKRLSLSLPLFGGKSFVDPRKCLSLFNHFCNIKVPQLGANWTVEVHPNIGLTHHYKKCSFEPETCERMTSAQEEDDTMLRFESALTKLYQSQIKQIGLD